jgi:hypothetical protein
MIRAILHILLGLWISLPLRLHAQTAAAVPEYTMKAAYLYNFALLTTLPDAAKADDADFNLCVYGQDDFGAALDKLNGKDVNGQKVRVLRLDRAEDALRCQLIFIGDIDPQRALRLNNVLAKAPVLTVADDKWGKTAMINLVPQNQRLTFTINASAARSAKLQLSSKLMRLAALVETP